MAERAHPEDPTYRGTIDEDRLRERYAFCTPYMVGQDVLDVPCGTGWGSSLLDGYSSLTGLDIDSAAIAYARNRFPTIQFLEGSMDALPFEDASFDVVICLEGLEHVFRSDAAHFLAEARRVLRPEGMLILTAPLLRDGRHSTNPYHMYEFTTNELHGLIAPLFDITTFETIAGPEGPEVRAVGRRREKVLPATPRDTSAYALHDHLTHWLDTIRTEDGFRYAEGTPQNMIGTACAILTREGLGQIESATADERQSWGVYLQGCQDVESGIFRDPLLAQYPVESEYHDDAYLLEQMSYFSLQALDALGRAPLYPLHFADRYTDPAQLTAWLAGLDWSNAWLASNRVMFALSFLIYRAERSGDAQAATMLHAALDWLDAQQDESGLWGERAGSSRLNAMAAAYHFLPFYEYVRRPIARLNAMIDATLSLQQPDGMFGPGPGGGACEDLDAIDILAVAAKYTNYRAVDVRRALVRAFWAIWNTRNDDGGFPYALRTDDTTYRFSSWAPLETHLRASDTWATWVRLSTLHTIQKLYPADLPALPEWRFRRWPALGYHRIDERLSAEERTLLPIWLRPLPAAPAQANAHPRISVVIPCYNLGRYLYEALDTVLRQTLQPIEVIVVDDGSTDEFTQFYLDHIEHPQLRVMRHENRGLPATRNAGITATRADYICCLDADDRVRPEFFARAAALLDADEQIGFVSSYYQEFDGRSGQVRYATCDLPEMLVTNRAMVSSLFRRTAWELAGGYAEALSGMQDWDLWIGMLEVGYRGTMVPEVLFEYRVRDGSMYSTTRRPENYTRLIGQMIARHPSIYQRWHADVMAGMAGELARSVMYAEGQSQLAQLRQREIERLQQGGGVAPALHEHVTYLEGQITNLNAELERWHTIAAQRAEWAAQLEAARDYHSDQSRRWQELAVAKEQPPIVLAAPPEVAPPARLNGNLLSALTRRGTRKVRELRAALLARSAGAKGKRSR